MYLRSRIATVFFGFPNRSQGRADALEQGLLENVEEKNPMKEVRIWGTSVYFVGGPLVSSSYWKILN